jgi:hypothetical protein
MLNTLAYPRSGSTLIQFLLRYANPPIATTKLHGHDMFNMKKDAVDDKLLTIIRNYKECIMSHLTRDDDQHNITKIKEAFVQYIKVLEVFENSECTKCLIYYEDLITNPTSTLQKIANCFGYDIKRVLDNLDVLLEESRQSYIRELGTTQTSGKTIIHFTPITKHYKFDWDHEVRNLNPELYDKYLKLYGEIND